MVNEIVLLVLSDKEYYVERRGTSTSKENNVTDGVAKVGRAPNKKYSEKEF
jgi:hypothetical protein